MEGLGLADLRAHAQTQEESPSLNEAARDQTEGASLRHWVKSLNAKPATMHRAQCFSELVMSCITALQANQSEAGKQRVREQHEAWAHDQGYGAWWQRWTDAVGTDESHMEQQFDNEMEALRGAVNRQATNQGGMRACARILADQLYGRLGKMLAQIATKQFVPIRCGRRSRRLPVTNAIA